MILSVSMMQAAEEMREIMRKSHIRYEKLTVEGDMILLWRRGEVVGWLDKASALENLKEAL